MATARQSNEIPDSISVQTGAYDIPTNYYAIVTAQVHSGGTFTIGGNTALSSLSSDQTWNVLGGSGTKVDANGSLGTVAGPVGNNAFSQSTAYDRIRTDVVAQFKVPQGTSLNGTGSFKYTVELYKMPGT